MEGWPEGTGPDALDRARREDGLSQTELAALLGIGQPHLSKLLTSVSRPSAKLGARISDYLRKRAGREIGLPGWVHEVAEMAATSPAFQQLVISALALARNKKE
ncbi:helix-turn-helix transcriptional regulator [Pararoseomonas sp. SCSIO 73927]|uniref:helix-turn-helix domain-containing protein n=1 Tax=Pararoseomonas sp. SCSIO 73927 TaxID=3114537 RepID=UPI0030CB1ED1